MSQSRRRNYPITAAAARPGRPPPAAFTTDDAIRARPPPPRPAADSTPCPATAGRRPYSRLPPPIPPPRNLV